MRPQPPHLDGSIQRGTAKGIGILGINLDLHDVMGVAFKHLRTIKPAIPIPQFNRHVVRGRQYVGERGVHFERSNVIRVAFKFLDFFHGIVIKDAEAHIVTGGNEPLFAFDKLCAADWQFGNFKGLCETARFVIPNHDMSRVQGGQDPGFGIVQVD